MVNYQAGKETQEYLNQMVNRFGIRVSDESVMSLAEHLLVPSYPQYIDHWDDCVMVVINERIVTKMGVAFESGDVTIGKHSTITAFDNNGNEYERACFTAFSFRNIVDTAVRCHQIVIK